MTGNFWKNARSGYMGTVGFVSVFWAYLFSGRWCTAHFEDWLFAAMLFCLLIPLTPFVYLCVAPFVAFLEGTKEEEV